MHQLLLFWLLILAIFFRDDVRADPRVTNAEFQPLITTSELVVGHNRFAFGLLKENRLVENADVRVRLYAIEGKNAYLTAESNALFKSIQVRKRQHKMHRHPNGTRHVHSADTGVHGIYVTHLDLPRSGPFGIEISVREMNGASATARTTVVALDSPYTPAVGSAAPRSRNLIARDVKDLRQIDTSTRPDPRLHQVRIADAIDQSKPQLIVFATPQFCTSRMCTSVVEIVRTLLPVYGNRFIFTHQEIWQDFARKKFFPTVEEWGLRSEPWIFVVDSQGIVRAKFEGLATTWELESALQQVLAPGPARR